MALSEAALEERRRGYEVFDTLPPKVREALRNAWDNLNPEYVVFRGHNESAMLKVIEQEDIDCLDAFLFKLNHGDQSPRP